MWKLILLSSLILMSNLAVAKTISDFIDEYPELASSQAIKTAIEQYAIETASMDVMDNDYANASGDKVDADIQKLLTTHGYEYAQEALIDLATNSCEDSKLSDAAGLSEEDCLVISKVASEAK